VSLPRGTLKGLLGGARRPRDELLSLEEKENVKEEKGGMKENAT
jgi:hypothetical protein